MLTNTGMVLTSWLLHDSLVELTHVSLGFLQQCTCTCFHSFHLLVLLALSTLALHLFGPQLVGDGSSHSPTQPFNPCALVT